MLSKDLPQPGQGHSPVVEAVRGERRNALISSSVGSSTVPSKKDTRRRRLRALPRATAHENSESSILTRRSSALLTDCISRCSTCALPLSWTWTAAPWPCTCYRRPDTCFVCMRPSPRCAPAPSPTHVHRTGTGRSCWPPIPLLAGRTRGSGCSRRCWPRAGSAWSRRS